MYVRMVTWASFFFGAGFSLAALQHVEATEDAKDEAPEEKAES